MKNNFPDNSYYDQDIVSDDISPISYMDDFCSFELIVNMILAAIMIIILIFMMLNLRSVMI